MSDPSQDALHIGDKLDELAACITSVLHSILVELRSLQPGGRYERYQHKADK